MITCRIEMRSTILVNQNLQIILGKFYKKIQNKQTLKKKIMGFSKHNYYESNTRVYYYKLIYSLTYL